MGCDRGQSGHRVPQDGVHAPALGKSESEHEKGRESVTGVVGDCEMRKGSGGKVRARVR